MFSNRVIFVGLLFVITVLFVSSFVGGFFHREEPRLAPFNASVTVGNQAPQIITVFNVTDFVSDSGTVTPVANSTIATNFSFIVDDPNGGGTIDLDSAVANYTFNGINRTSDSCFAPTTCPACADPTRQRNFTCTVNITYYDEAALRQWIVNVTVNDSSGATALNDTTNFTMASITAFDIISSPPTISWTSLVVDTNVNNQSANNNLSMENFGNFALGSGSITAFELNGSLTPNTQHIHPGNFSVSSDYFTIPIPECDISGIHGNDLIFGTPVSIPGLSLPISSDTTLGIENSTFCIFPNLSLTGLDPSQTFSSISQDWILTLP